ncbi:hypothetical protein [Streptomyces avicenniae]|nr:hypothetical protein [Streptomyces avicenniae]
MRHPGIRTEAFWSTPQLDAMPDDESRVTGHGFVRLGDVLRAIGGEVP